MLWDRLEEDATFAAADLAVVVVQPLGPGGRRLCHARPRSRVRAFDLERDSDGDAVDAGLVLRQKGAIERVAQRRVIQPGLLIITLLWAAARGKSLYEGNHGGTGKREWHWVSIHSRRERGREGGREG